MKSLSSLISNEVTSGIAIRTSQLPPKASILESISPIALET